MIRHFFRLIIVPLTFVVACILLTFYSLRTQASLLTQLSPQSENDSYGIPLTATAATIAIHSRQGQGAVYQSTYLPLATDAQNNSVSWIGQLSALFIDASGNFREDGNADGVLQEDDYAIDPAVMVFLDETDKTNKIARFKFKVTPNTSKAFASEIKPLNDLRTLWSAHKQLSGLSDVTTQRAYTAKANTGRYIFTFLDFNGDGIVENTETKDFVPDSFSSGGHGALNVQDAASASSLVNYIRGDESQNAGKRMRNRTLHTENGTAEVMRLGDIVNSTPTEVAAPAEAFDLLYGDKSYGTFRSKYAKRRHVVYVGANDGMIHAFNAGFYNAKTQSYDLQGNGAEVQHPLGSELWAYVPYNLLPHLHELQSRKYRHRWYVDGKPRIFDAKIFTTDATHPGGWGTVMVVGMRFGGAPVTLDADSNKAGFSAFTSSGAAIKTLTTHSAYALIDITDPEQKPTLLAEISDPEGSMGFTTSYPTIASFSNGKDNQWYLILGSGPTVEKTATSTVSAKLYVYDLVKKEFLSKGTNSYLFDLAGQAPDSFIGDPVSADWNLDFKTDAVYFGTVGGSEISPAGKLFKLALNTGATNANETSNPNQWAVPGVLIDPGNPIVSAPSITKDEQGYRWVSSGTGRLFSQSDQHSKQAQSLFAVIDTLPAATPSYKELVDVSNAKVSPNGSVDNVKGARTQSELIQLIQTQKGWKRTLAHNSAGIAERNISSTSLLGGTLFATAVTPCGTEQCGNASSSLYCLHYKTGTANARLPACGLSDEVSGSAPVGVANDVIDLGAGISASANLHLDRKIHSGSNKLTVITQSTTGIITQSRAQASAIVRSGEIDWREINQ